MGRATCGGPAGGEASMCLHTLATLEVTPTPVQMMCCHSDRRCGTWAPFIVAVLFSSASAGLMMSVACPAGLAEPGHGETVHESTRWNSSPVSAQTNVHPNILANTCLGVSSLLLCVDRVPLGWSGILA